MEPFVELHHPLPEQVFEDWKGMWFVGKKDTMTSFLECSTNNVVFFAYGGGIPDPSVARFYFDTAIDAHEAAVAYYGKYNKPYPYMGMYVAAGGTVERANEILSTIFNSDVESQVMDFA